MIILKIKFFVISLKNILCGFLIVSVFAAAGFFMYSFSEADKEAVETFAVPVTNKVILIDPGHGGIDAGASANGAVEKDINLDIALKLQKFIEENGGIAILTRSEDVSTADKNRSKNLTQKKSDLMERKKAIEEYKADVFVSIHMNKFSEEKYYGAQVFYPSKSEDSKKLGEIMQASLKEHLDKTNKRKAKEDKSIYVLKNNEVPSVLIECGFLSNKAEAAKFLTSEYRQKTAWAIYLGLIKFFL